MVTSLRTYRPLAAFLALSLLLGGVVPLLAPAAAAEPTHACCTDRCPMDAGERQSLPPQTDEMPCCVVAPVVPVSEAAFVTEAAPRLMAAWVTVAEVFAAAPSPPVAHVVARDTGPPSSGPRLHLALSVLLI